MDRAAQALFQRIVGLAEIYSPVLVMAGPGNNGGDALAVARLLHQAGFQVCTALCQYGKFLSDDARAQWERLKSVPGHKLIIPQSVSELQALPTAGLIIDGLFGSGLNRPLEGLFAETVRWINVQPAFKVAIDLPSGLFGEDNRQAIREHVVKANLTLGLQFPRLAFLLPENAEQVGDWECLDIGIHPEAIRSLDTIFSGRIAKKSPKY
jgi:NAD(P)H-hydrate epimerase